MTTQSSFRGEAEKSNAEAINFIIEKLLALNFALDLSIAALFRDDTWVVTESFPTKDNGTKLKVNSENFLGLLYYI